MCLVCWKLESSEMNLALPAIASNFLYTQANSKPTASQQQAKVWQLGGRPCCHNYFLALTEKRTVHQTCLPSELKCRLRSWSWSRWSGKLYNCRSAFLSTISSIRAFVLAWRCKFLPLVRWLMGVKVKLLDVQRATTDSLRPPCLSERMSQASNFSEVALSWWDCACSLFVTSVLPNRS